MRAPSRADVENLLEWSSQPGIVSAYVAVDPADRGQGWRIDLRNRLHEIAESANGAAAACERILERLSGDETPEGRTQIAFVEASTERGARAEWFAAQVPIPHTLVRHGRAPLLAPLVGLLDEGAARAIALVSAERVRLLRWEFGMVEELDSWGLEILSLDWRERKAPRPVDPGRGQGVSASGHDRFDDRLEANRDRFLAETGRLAAAHSGELGLESLIAIGHPEHSRPFAAGAGDTIEIAAGDTADLISAPTGRIEDRLAELVSSLNRSHEAELVARALDAARSGGRGALGQKATEHALREGSVERLLLARSRSFAPADDGESEPSESAEELVRAALATSAAITVVGHGAGEELARSDGVGALLRYRPTTPAT